MRSCIANAGDLINPTWPGNTGLVSEWANLPSGVGGGGDKWRDWVRKSGNHGTLTNGPTWAGASGRPGGFGAMSFTAASSQYVDCGLPLSGTYSQLTLAAWMYRATTGLNVMVGVTTGNTLELNWFSNDNFYAIVMGTYSPVAEAVSGWHHFALTLSAATTRMFFDGNFIGTFGTVNYVSDANHFTLGRDVNNGLYAQGLIDGVTLHARALADSEVAALYDQSRRGNPDRWRWLSTRYYAPPAAADTLFAQICC